MGKNSSKTEQKGISILRNLLDKMDTVTYSLEEGDKNISWDGDIKLYKNADIIYSIRPPSELQPHIEKLSQKVKGTFIIKPLCNEDLNIRSKKAKLKNYKKASFYIL